MLSERNDWSVEIRVTGEDIVAIDVALLAHGG
jgi:hypothetical protein